MNRTDRILALLLLIDGELGLLSGTHQGVVLCLLACAAAAYLTFFPTDIP